MVAACAVCTAVATQALGAVHGTRATAVISRNANGPSGGGAFSQDARRVRYYAFASAASNLAPGDTNGRFDVFVLKRHPGAGSLGGDITRASLGSDEQQSNGDSSSPSFDGDTHHSPHCVAFQSTATNLSPADPAPDSDVYVRNLLTRRTGLVSTAQTNAVHPVIDGGCELVTFEAMGGVYLRDLLSNKTYRVATGDQAVQQADGKGVVFERGGQIYHQAYQRIHNHGHGPAGCPVLVAAALRLCRLVCLRRGDGWASSTHSAIRWRGARSSPTLSVSACSRLRSKRFGAGRRAPPTVRSRPPAKCIVSGRTARNALLSGAIVVLWVLWVLRAMPSFWLLLVIITLPARNCARAARDRASAASTRTSADRRDDAERGIGLHRAGCAGAIDHRRACSLGAGRSISAPSPVRTPC